MGLGVDGGMGVVRGVAMDDCIPGNRLRIKTE